MVAHIVFTFQCFVPMLSICVKSMVLSFGLSFVGVKSMVLSVGLSMVGVKFWC